MRLGGAVFGKFEEPGQWVSAVKALGYRAAYCPVNEEDSPEKIRAYRDAAEKADLVIAEVGAWANNPISPDEAERKRSIANCQKKLALAEAVGARCCVNVAGSRGKVWASPHPENLTEATLELIVASVREIVDAIKPTRTCWVMETMPYVWPDSPESYLRMVKAVDRKGFAAHLDPVNMINTLDRYYHNGAFMRECFRLLGPMIKSCHAKDIKLMPPMPINLTEVRPGLGTLNYGVLLTEAAKLDQDFPVMLEHLPSAEEYALAAAYVRGEAAKVGVGL